MDVDHFPPQTVSTYSGTTALEFSSSSPAFWKDNGLYQRLVNDSVGKSSIFPDADLTILDVDVLALPEFSSGSSCSSMPTTHNLHEGHGYGAIPNYNSSVYDGWDYNSISSNGNSCPSLESWSPISECYSDRYYNGIAHVQSSPAQIEEITAAIQSQKVTIDDILVGPVDDSFWSLNTSTGIDGSSWQALPLFPDEAKANDETLLSTISEDSWFHEYTHIESIYATTTEPEPVQ